ncbi:alpha-L-fucosidase [Parapedobacter tibetensis]|uniref:alpha-L-fucosidase n=1 Tax=Parapedobacter tibetensis TaxID=2972951 RepID=UPI00214D6724|nr:alpha-L-fucosidase [Parapedobacter tibetensis]
MKRTPLLFFTLLVFACCALAQTVDSPKWANESHTQKEERMAWWSHDRFGMFIHWGLYAVPARHEWVQNREQLSTEAYRGRYFDQFNPDLYDPKEWAAQAKKAGMKYVVITARHHEGFSLWDTKHSDYKAPNTPASRDLLKPFVEAFRNEGLKIGFYFSLIDWYHPDFIIDRVHPLRNDKAARDENGNKDMGRFRQFLKNQLTELLTDYGKIDLLFFDFSYPGEDGKGHEDWDSEGLLELTRKLQPGILVNDRLDLNDKTWGWDYITPEQFMPKAWPERDGVQVPWETCQTFSGSWGYHRDENTWKSANQLIAMLIEVVSKGGNLLLNVGPTGRGNFDDRATDRLDAIGQWMKYNNRSIYGCTAAPEEFVKPDNCLLTYNPDTKRLYVHLLQWPFKTLYLPNFKGKVKYAQFLHDGSEVKYTSRSSAEAGGHTTVTAGENDLIVDIPVVKPNVEIPVIELILE